MAIRTNYIDQITVRIERDDMEKIKEIQRVTEEVYEIRNPFRRIIHLALRDYYDKVKDQVWRHKMRNGL